MKSMLYKIGSKLAIVVFWLSICAISSGVIFYVLNMAGASANGFLFLSFLLGAPTCIISLILLIFSFFNKELRLKYFKKIIISFILSFIPPALVIGIFACAFHVIFHEKPYSETHPSTIINFVEKDFGFKFPSKMDSLRAGDTIAAGIDHDYVFIFRFVTDQNGLSEMKKYGQWREVTEDIKKGEWDDPRYFTKCTPDWFKKIEQGTTYEGCIDRKGPLQVICIEMSNDEVITYVNGWCRWQIVPKDILDILDK